jgi:hypothetical protein
MAIIAPVQKSYPKAPEGVQRAVCVGIYDVGTHVQTGQFGVSSNRQVLLQFELPDAKQEDGKSFTINTTFTLSMHEKANLRKFLGSWRGKPLTDAECSRFDVSQMLGHPAQVQVVHNAGKNGNVYANIGSIMSMPKGMPVPEYDSELKQFSIEEPEIPGDVPRWIAEKIRNSKEWQAKAGAPRSSAASPDFDEFAGQGDSDPSVPF